MIENSTSLYLGLLFVCAPVAAMQDWKEEVNNKIMQLQSLENKAIEVRNNASERNKVLFQGHIDGITQMKTLITELKRQSELNNHVPDENDLSWVRIATKELERSLGQSIEFTNKFINNK